MTGVLAAVLLLAAAGLPVAAWLEPSFGWRARLGAGFMLGAGIATLALLLATTAGLEWSRAALIVALAVPAVAALAGARRAQSRSAGAMRPTPLSATADAATLLSLCGYTLFATLAPPWEWDFWAIWGLKAKEYDLERGVSFAFLANPDNVFSHPDYPPLVPLTFDVAALLQGSWDDRWMGLVSVAFALAMLLVVREELERQSGSATVGALGTLALSGAACSPWVGLGDGPLVALASAGLLVASRGLREDDARAIVTGGLLLGLAGLAKNEGVSFIAAAVAMGVVVARRRAWLLALPAAATVAPWMLVRLALAAPTDVFEGGFMARASERLSDPGVFFGTLAAGQIERPGFWAIALVALALAPAAARRERFLIGVALLQSLAYVAIYAGTLNDLASHVQSSLARVTSHVAPLAGIVAALAIGGMLRGDEARSPGGWDDRGHEA